MSAKRATQPAVPVGEHYVALVGGDSMYGARFEAGDPLPADVGEELAAIGLAVKVSPAPAGDEPGDDEKGAQ